MTLPSGFSASCSPVTESLDAARPEGARTYPALLESLREVSRDNQVSGTVDRERRRTRTYWDMGDQIHRHLLRHEGKPKYGEQVISKLANDLEMTDSLLYDILRLRRAFPIFHTCGKLPWSHSRQLVGLQTLVEREFYARVAVEMSWSVRQLKEEIRRGLYAQAREKGEASYRPVQPISPTQLRPRRGHPYTYRLVSSLPGQGHADLVVDLGFGHHWSGPLEGLDQPRPGQIVTSTKKGLGPASTWTFQPVAVTGRRLWTFCALVDRVIDGDTLLVRVDLGFRSWTVERLRLRGIDAARLDSRAGQRARDRVEELVRSVDFVVLATARTDRYGRYLADIFYGVGVTGPAAVAEKGTYLNRQLLEEGLAGAYV